MSTGIAAQPTKRPPQYTVGGLVKTNQPVKSPDVGETSGPFRIIALGTHVVTVLRRLFGAPIPGPGDEVSVLPLEMVKPYAVKRDNTPTSLGGALHLIRKLKAQLEACQQKAHIRRGEARYNQGRIDRCKALLTNALGAKPESVVEGIRQLVAEHRRDGESKNALPPCAADSPHLAAVTVGEGGLYYSRKAYAAMLLYIYSLLGLEYNVPSNIGTRLFHAKRRIAKLVDIETEHEALLKAPVQQAPPAPRTAGKFFGTRHDGDTPTTDPLLRAVERARSAAPPGSGYCDVAEYVGALFAIQEALGTNGLQFGTLSATRATLAEIQRLRVFEASTKVAVPAEL